MSQSLNKQLKVLAASDCSQLLLLSGEYLVSVKFNDQHIPDSPFKVYILPSGGDTKKLHVQNLQQHGLQVIIAEYTSSYLCVFHQIQLYSPLQVDRPKNEDECFLFVQLQILMSLLYLLILACVVNCAIFHVTRFTCWSSSTCDHSVGAPVVNWSVSDESLLKRSYINL